jgi:hypothetical protein
VDESEAMSRNVLKYLLALCLALTTLGASATQAAPQRLLLPDLQCLPEALEDHYISYEDGQKLLRFTAGLVNTGKGPVEVQGRRTSRRGTMRAYQALYKSRNRVGALRRFGQFVWHNEHEHWHVLQIAEYRLVDADGNLVANANKVSFCLIDTTQAYPQMQGSPSWPKYYHCPRDRGMKKIVQGVSVGWGDVYGDNLSGQWVDVTDVPPGQYFLECVINPDRALREESMENNVKRVPVTIE